MRRQDATGRTRRSASLALTHTTLRSPCCTGGAPTRVVTATSSWLTLNCRLNRYFRLAHLGCRGHGEEGDDLESLFGLFRRRCLEAQRHVGEVDEAPLLAQRLPERLARHPIRVTAIPKLKCKTLPARAVRIARSRPTTYYLLRRPRPSRIPRRNRTCSLQARKGGLRRCVGTGCRGGCGVEKISRRATRRAARRPGRSAPHAAARNAPLSLLRYSPAAPLPS